MNIEIKETILLHVLPVLIKTGENSNSRKFSKKTPNSKISEIVKIIMTTHTNFLIWLTENPIFIRIRIRNQL